MGGTPDGFVLLEITLDTGRMHQIRRHLALLGAPVLGDGKYGDFSLNRKLKKERGLKHLLLHAARISFDDGGTRRTAEAPLPDYFTPFLPAGYTAPLAGLTADQAAESCR